MGFYCIDKSPSYIKFPEYECDWNRKNSENGVGMYVILMFINDDSYDDFDQADNDWGNCSIDNKIILCRLFLGSTNTIYVDLYNNDFQASQKHLTEEGKKLYQLLCDLYPNAKPIFHTYRVD